MTTSAQFHHMIVMLMLPAPIHQVLGYVYATLATRDLDKPARVINCNIF